MHRKGLVTKETLLSTQESLRTARAALNAMNTDLHQAEVSRLSAERTNESERRQNEARVRDTDRQIQLLKQRFEQSSHITSAYSGRVVELRAMVGDVVEPGQPIASLERTTGVGVLEALLYLDSREGKRVRPGMRVEISPTMARRERYGVIYGQVRSVEDFPSTRRGMVQALHNEQLVDKFLTDSQGVAIAVRATLDPDPSAPGGYLWTSRRGAMLKLSSGTRCTAAVITGWQRPLALVFPTLERIL